MNMKVNLITISVLWASKKKNVKTSDSFCSEKLFKSNMEEWDFFFLVTY